MRLTKMGHACVRLEKDDATLVIDPGSLTEPEALYGAHSVLITHEHFDHLDADRLREAVTANPQLEIWTNRGVAEQLGGLDGHVHTVGEGDSFSAAGFDVGVLGREHEIIYPDLPRVANIGFFIDGEVFHPGDAFTVPDAVVGTLLVPTNAPWMKLSEMIDYLRDVAPARAFSVHDGLLNEYGLGIIDSTLNKRGAQINSECRRIKPGETVTL